MPPALVPHVADNRPIGFFDSGIGGLTILAAARQLLPRERVLFLADSAHFPYGAVAPDTLRALAELAAGFLVDRGCKLIVVACNTATVHALDHLRARFPGVPFVGVVPVVKLLAERTRTGTIALLSTPATAGSAYLADLVARFAARCTVVNLACPGLADLVEERPADDPAILALLATHLAPARSSGADVLGLGCTHYPLIRPHIRDVVGRSVRIYDSALPVARRIEAVLAERDAFAAGSPALSLIATGNPDHLARAARRLFGDEATSVRQVRLDGARERA